LLQKKKKVKFYRKLFFKCNKSKLKKVRMTAKQRGWGGKKNTVEPLGTNVRKV
jgi:hypothetical protein